MPEVFIDAKEDVSKEFAAEVFEMLKKCGFEKIKRGAPIPILEKISVNSGNVLEEFKYSDNIEISGSKIVIPRVLHYSIYSHRSPLKRSTSIVSIESAKVLKNFDFEKHIIGY